MYEIEQLKRRIQALEAEVARLEAQQLESGRSAIEQQRHAIFDSSPDFAIIVTDQAGRLTDWNIGADRIFGWSGEQMRGLSVERIFTPEDRAEGRPQAEMLLSLASGRAIDERWHLRANGSLFWASGVLTPLRKDGDGQLIGFMKILRDRTEEHLAGQRLEASEEHYRTLFEAIDVGFCVIEVKFEQQDRAVDFRYIETNSAFEQQTGLVGAEGRWMRDLIPEHEQRWFEIYGEVALTGKAVRFEQTAEALGRWYDVHALRIGDPATHRVAIFFNDISRRRKAELALEELTASLRNEVAARTQDRNQLWELSGVVMIRAKLDGTVIAANPAWKELLGWAEAELIGTCIFDLVHPDDLERTQERAHLSPEKQPDTSFENRYRCKQGGYRWISWSARLADDVINAVGRDITEEKKQADALAKAEAQLRQSQKMESVGQLTGGLAHDFNNLLTGIAGSLELLQLRIVQGRLADINRYIETAQNASRRAAALTHRLLAFSRRQTLDPKPTNINRLVADMEEMIRRSVGPAVDIEIAAAKGLWITCVDQSQLDNALLNLCINARDAMPSGGRLKIETANRRLDDEAANALDIAPGQYVSLCVADNGMGMPPNVVANAFEPFFTTKPLGFGTGLGLSMVYGFANQSGGQAHISSGVGDGTTVCLYLPRYDSEATDTPVSDEQAEAPETIARNGETVLVVDDEATVRMLAAEVLEDLGFTVLEASDGASGLKILQSSARMDLLVTDVGLPGGMNGRQLADAARVEQPELKVLFITGYAENAVMGNGKLEAGMHIMIKPFLMQDLAVRVKELIDNCMGGEPYSGLSQSGSKRQTDGAGR
ncbi:PAS domain S-box protein [Pseudomonas sp. Q2-TVG4-2]|uniref:hybrid sensor histidine kinase/response regulator n=1 Tax=Pseudomonas sp. Q2-TVG4-2 TaxID=1685699 RepID=UPI002810D1E2|nr:PAS domain S-box protein [Pseudomonas sp. Q2-TVG4-2]